MRQPPCVEPDMERLNHPGRDVLYDLKLRIITPVFGGSSKAGQVDPERPVSASQIRGQLRFWWRACYETFYPDGQLYEKETLIWGSTDTPSAVNIHVEIDECAKPKPYALFDKGRRDNKGNISGMPEFPGYALFPFRGESSDNRKEIAKDPACYIDKLSFRVLVGTNPDTDITLSETQKEQVRLALITWILFGGIGARTRRGCGSLYCHNFNKELGVDLSNAEWINSIRKNVSAAFKGKDTHNGITPVLKNARLVIGLESKTNPISAWRIAVEAMQQFRQGEGFARNQGSDPTNPRRLGRSRWPEPDSIRDAVHSHCQRHAPEHPARAYYPRANLGLPIVFQFIRQNQCRCPDPQILAAGKPQFTRMASPIILKALALSPTEAVPIALLLNAPHVWDPGTPGVTLNGTPIPSGKLLDPAKSGKVKPLDKMNSDNARDAFMKYARIAFNQSAGKQKER